MANDLLAMTIVFIVAFDVFFISFNQYPIDNMFYENLWLWKFNFVVD